MPARFDHFTGRFCVAASTGFSHSMSTPERLLSQTLAPPAGAVPVPWTHGARRTAVGVRAWLLTAFLFCLPVVAYWPATFHEYGLRDDYSNLRESHEELGKGGKFCPS